MLLAVVALGVVVSAVDKPDISDDALDMALQDKRYFTRQLKCALGEGACDPVGRRLKSECNTID